LISPQLISLIYGGDFDVFAPRGVTFDDEDYNAHILMQHFRYFGPFAPKYAELFWGGEAGKELDMDIQYVFDNVPESERKPFSLVNASEVLREDRDFICKIMKLDPRDRPTAKALLQDRWFEEDSEK
jgi:hypothetical protein